MATKLEANVEPDPPCRNRIIVIDSAACPPRPAL